MGDKVISDGLSASAIALAMLVTASACVSPTRAVRMDSRIDSLRSANLTLTVEKNVLADSLAMIDYVGSGEMDRDVRRLQNEVDRLTYDLQSCRRGGEFVSKLLVDDIFEPASARLTKLGQARIDTVLTRFMTDDGRHVAIVGHSDSSQPGATLGKTYPTNWELAGARAAAVVRYIISSRGIDPKNISAISHGDAHPEYSNGTPDGRRRNRRIEILRH
jgi:chemotaxis protein MotB